MPHIDTVGNDELKDLADALWSAKPRLTQDETNRLFRLQREAKEAKLRLINQIEESRMAHAEQVKFDFAVPGPDWGSTDRSYQYPRKRRKRR